MRKRGIISLILIVYMFYLYNKRIFFIDHSIEINMANVMIYAGMSRQVVAGIMSLFMIIYSMTVFDMFFGRTYIFKYGNVLHAIEQFVVHHFWILVCINVAVLTVNIIYVSVMSGCEITAEEIRLLILSFLIVDLWVLEFVQSGILICVITQNRKVSILLMLFVCILIAFAPVVISQKITWYGLETINLIMSNMKIYAAEIFKLILIYTGTVVMTGVGLWKKDISV